MKTEISEKIAKYKEMITGILVIAGVIGGLYGSLKGEHEARESHSSLAPAIDIASDMLLEQEIRLNRMEAKQEVYQEIFTGVFLDAIDKEALIEAVREYEEDELIDEGFVPMPPPPIAPIAEKPQPKKKKKKEAPLKKPRPVQQRKKTSWEQKMAD